MKKITLLIALLLTPAVNTSAQVSRVTQQFTSTGTTSKITLIASGATSNQLQWNALGTVSACTVALDSSSDGTTWTAGGAIAGQTCTSTGSSVVTAGTFNYVRINVTALTGTGSVIVTALSFPSGAGSTTPGGAAGAVQFNLGPGTFGGDATNFFYDNAAHNLSVTGTLTAGLGIFNSASAAGCVKLNELPANGSTYVQICSPDSVTASTTWKWPAADGTANQVIKTDGSHNLSFVSAGTGTVTSVGVAAPADFTVTNSPVTTNGTLTLSYNALGSMLSIANVPYLSAPGNRKDVVCAANASNTFVCGAGDTNASDGGSTGFTAPASGVPANIFQSTSATPNTPQVQRGQAVHFLGRTHGLRYRWLAAMDSTTSVKQFGCATTLLSAAQSDNSGAHDSKAAGNYACIYYDNAGLYQTPPANATTHYVCLTDDGTAANQQAVDSGVNADTSWHWFEVVENSSTNYLFFIDGNQVCSLSGVGLPTTNTPVRYLNGGQGSTSTSVNLRIAGVWISEDWK